MPVKGSATEQWKNLRDSHSEEVGAFFNTLNDARETITKYVRGFDRHDPIVVTLGNLFSRQRAVKLFVSDENPNYAYFLDITGTLQRARAVPRRSAVHEVEIHDWFEGEISLDTIRLLREDVELILKRWKTTRPDA